MKRLHTHTELRSNGVLVMTVREYIPSNSWAWEIYFRLLREIYEETVVGDRRTGVRRPIRGVLVEFEAVAGEEDVQGDVLPLWVFAMLLCSYLPNGTAMKVIVPKAYLGECVETRWSNNPNFYGTSTEKEMASYERWCTRPWTNECPLDERIRGLRDRLDLELASTAAGKAA